MRTGTLTLTIDSHLDHVFLVGLAVHRICTAAALDEQAAYEVEAAVVEAVNNAIEHAYANRPGHRVDVQIRLEADRLIVQVCDVGHPIPVQRWEQTSRSSGGAETLAERGRGLAIMRGFMDAVDYTRDAGRNVVTLVKRLPGERHGASR